MCIQWGFNVNIYWLARQVAFKCLFYFVQCDDLAISGLSIDCIQGDLFGAVVGCRGNFGDLGVGYSFGVDNDFFVYYDISGDFVFDDLAYSYFVGLYLFSGF